MGKKTEVRRGQSVKTQENKNRRSQFQVSCFMVSICLPNTVMLFMPGMSKRVLCYRTGVVSSLRYHIYLSNKKCTITYINNWTQYMERTCLYVYIHEDNYDLLKIVDSYTSGEEIIRSCGIWRSSSSFTKATHWKNSYAISVQPTPSHPIVLILIVILSYNISQRRIVFCFWFSV